MSYQMHIIVGNVGRDPELRYTQAGVAVCDFSVAANKRWTDRTTGQKREKTTWFRVSAWRGLAETVNKYVKKGRQVLIESDDIEASPYTAQDGQPAASLEVTAREVVFLGANGERIPLDAEDELAGEEPEELPF